MIARSAAALALAALCGCSDEPAGDAPRDAAATADAEPAADAGLPDLRPDRERSRADLAVRTASFETGTCELHADEACVDAPGERTLLHFSATAENHGAADLVIGPPSADNPAFVFSECHRHYHLQGFAAYRLRDAAGNEVVTGRKQAFCLVDTHRVLAGDDIAPRARYDCEDQGISRGWADVYESRVPCQLLDVTDLPAGDYLLEIELDPEGLLGDADRSDNLATIPVTLGDPALASATEPCPADLPAAATAGPHRECGWTEAATLPCPAGDEVGVACAETCALARCEGAPMLRVCDAAAASCAHPDALSVDETSCGSCAAIERIRCPQSGQLRILTAPRTPGDTFTCTPTVLPAD